MADHMPARRDDAATIDQLVGDLRPVKRLHSFRSALGVWLSVMGGVLAVAAWTPRPDLVSRTTQIGYLAELVGLAAVTVLLGAFAVRSAEPDRIPSPSEQVLGWGLAALALASVAIQPTVTGVSLDEFLAIGSRCAWATIKFAALPVLVLLVAVRRGAPVQPRSGGALAAGAGLVLAYLAMRLHCPMDDGSHLFVWHLVPVAIGTAGGALFGELWLGRWSRWR